MRFSKILITCVLLALATSCNKEDEFCSTQSTRPSSIETVSAGVYDFFNRVYISCQNGIPDDRQLYQLAEESVHDLLKSISAESIYLPVFNNWSCGDEQSLCFQKIAEVLYSNDLDSFDEIVDSVIQSLPAQEREPALLYANTITSLLSIPCPLTKSSGPWEDFWLSVSASALGSIYGAVIAAAFTDAAVGAAVGGAVGAIVGASVGVVVYYSQTLKVEGVVVDEYGEPITGATVTVAGQSMGPSVVTDLNGSFTIRVPNDCVLRISYLGYQEALFDTRDQIAYIKMLPY